MAVRTFRPNVDYRVKECTLVCELEVPDMHVSQLVQGTVAALSTFSSQYALGHGVRIMCFRVYLSVYA